ncbi:MAG TPA: YfhO family protein [Puia sp.]|nr:YfhO family protein [Puia sp.]
MNSHLLKKALPHILAIAVFLVVAIVYCHPALQGKVVGQTDVDQWKAMAQQSFDYKEKHGHFPLWTESAFSGMPGYTIAIDGMTGLNISYLGSVLTLGLPAPISYFFLACLCFYILMAVLRINPWIGVMASLAYAYCSYDPVIIVTGHITKMQAIAYAPAVIASLLLLFRRQYLWGTGLLAFFFALQLATQHLQVVYYTVISMGLLTLFYAIQSIREGKGKEMAIAIGLAVLAGGIGFGTSVGATLPVEEYTKETMRGGRTELTSDASKQKGKNGLDRDYAFTWSYGVAETMTLAVPNMFGGGNGDRTGVGDNSKLADVMAQDLGVPEDTGIQIANNNAYWGDQMFTMGTVYIGAVICFLCIFSLIVVKGWSKWWLLSTIVLGIFLAWGKNFPAFNNFLFDHFPLYNKFRAPSQALFMPQLAAPILAALGIQHLLTGGEDTVALWKKFKMTTYITGGLLVILVGFYFSTNFQGASDGQTKERFAQMSMQQLSRGKQPTPEVQQQAMATAGSLMRALEQDRRSMAGSDLVRSIIFIVLAAALLGLFLRKKFNPLILMGGLLVLSTYDLMAVGARYLSADSFQDPGDLQSSLTPTTADQQINADPDKNFRVVDESTGGNPFESARASAFHHSLGGYSPAKLGLYQDLIYNQLVKGNMQVYNMLNTKYFIQADQRNGQPVASRNPGAFGPCWLVNGIHFVKNGDEEMKALDSINVRDTVIIQQQFASRIPFQPVADSTASIRLKENDLDKIDYDFSAKTNQFAVFSEIYYDKGWDAYLDGKKTDYVRVNYALRGMAVPAGQHAIEFRFEPHSYKLGLMLTSWFSLVIYALLIAGLVVEWRKREAQKPAAPGATKV